MDTENKTLSLDNIGGGVALDLFNGKLQEIMENILDPSTEEKSIREIVLKFKFKPNSERTINNVGISASVKLGATKSFNTKAFIGKTAEGLFEAYEHNQTQRAIAFSSFINTIKITEASVVEETEDA